MQDRNRAPSPWLSITGTLFVAASFPVDGLPGIGLALAGVGLCATYLIRRRRAVR